MANLPSLVPPNSEAVYHQQYAGKTQNFIVDLTLHIARG
jgi:hypothetical protein